MSSEQAQKQIIKLNTFIIASERIIYSAIKRNKIRSFVEMWIDIKTVIQSEVSEKTNILTHMCVM